MGIRILSGLVTLSFLMASIGVAGALAEPRKPGIVGMSNVVGMSNIVGMSNVRAPELDGRYEEEEPQLNLRGKVLKNDLSIVQMSGIVSMSNVRAHDGWADEDEEELKAQNRRTLKLLQRRGAFSPNAPAEQEH